MIIVYGVLSLRITSQIDYRTASLSNYCILAVWYKFIKVLIANCSASEDVGLEVGLEFVAKVYFAKCNLCYD